MRLRICIVVDDVMEQANAAGWDMSESRDAVINDSQRIESALALDSEGMIEQSRILWAEVEIPPPAALPELVFVEGGGEE